MSLLPCAQASCEESATHVVAETDRLNCLFNSGAGLCCAEHTEEMQKIGGIALPFHEFVEAIRQAEFL